MTKIRDQKKEIQQRKEMQEFADRIIQENAENAANDVLLIN